MKKKVINDYKLIKLIEKTTNSKIYQAKHLGSNTTVAFKIIYDLEYFENEVECLHQLEDYEFTPKLYDSWTELDVSLNKCKGYIVMEFIYGHDLYNDICSLTTERLLKYLKQSLNIIEYIHSKNIVHRDIKSENLMLDSNDNIVLIDFGYGLYSGIIMGRSQWYALAGTDNIASTQLMDYKVNSIDMAKKEDKWCLGAAFYELIEGKHIYEDTDIVVHQLEIVEGGEGGYTIPVVDTDNEELNNIINELLNIY